MCQSQRLLCIPNGQKPMGTTKAFQSAKWMQVQSIAFRQESSTPRNHQQPEEHLSCLCAILSRSVSSSDSNWFGLVLFFLKKTFSVLGKTTGSNIFSNFFWQRKRRAYESNLMCDGLHLEATRSVGVGPFPARANRWSWEAACHLECWSGIWNL